MLDWHDINVNFTFDFTEADDLFYKYFDAVYSILSDESIYNNLPENLEAVLNNKVVSSLTEDEFWQNNTQLITTILFRTIFKYNLFLNTIQSPNNPILNQRFYLQIENSNWLLDKGKELYITLASFYATFLILSEYNAYCYLTGKPNVFNSALSSYFTDSFILFTQTFEKVTQIFDFYLFTKADISDFKQFILETFDFNLDIEHLYLKQIDNQFYLSTTHNIGEINFVVNKPFSTVSGYFQIPPILEADHAYRTVYVSIFADIYNKLLKPFHDLMYYTIVLNLPKDDVLIRISHTDLQAEFDNIYDLTHSRYFVVSFYANSYTLSLNQILLIYVLALYKQIMKSVYGYNVNLLQPNTAIQVTDELMFDYVQDFVFNKDKIPSYLLDARYANVIEFFRQKIIDIDYRILQFVNEHPSVAVNILFTYVYFFTGLTDLTHDFTAISQKQIIELFTFSITIPYRIFVFLLYALNKHVFSFGNFSDGYEHAKSQTCFSNLAFLFNCSATNKFFTTCTQTVFTQCHYFWPLVLNDYLLMSCSSTTQLLSQCNTDLYFKNCYPSVTISLTCNV